MGILPGIANGEMAIGPEPSQEGLQAVAQVPNIFERMQGTFSTMVEHIGDVIPRPPLGTVARLTAGMLAITGAGALAPAAEANIVPGQSIAGIKLGATEAQVRKAVGPPHTSTENDGQVEWTYDSINSRIPLVSDVAFTNTGGVALMETENPHERTSKGIGMGAKESAIKKAYPSVHCQPVHVSYIRMTHCNLLAKVHGKSEETVFELSQQYPDFEHFSGPPVERVDEIYVSIPADAPKTD